MQLSKASGVLGVAAALVACQGSPRAKITAPTAPLPATTGASLAPSLPLASAALPGPEALRVLVGQVFAPSGVIGNHGASILSNHGGAVLTNNGGSLIANHSAGLRLLQASGEVGRALAKVTVVVQGHGGRPLGQAESDEQGRFRIEGRWAERLVELVALARGEDGQPAPLRAWAASDAEASQGVRIDLATTLVVSAAGSSGSAPDRPELLGGFQKAAEQARQALTQRPEASWPDPRKPESLAAEAKAPQGALAAAAAELQALQQAIEAARVLPPPSEPPPSPLPNPSPSLSPGLPASPSPLPGASPLASPSTSPLASAAPNQAPSPLPSLAPSVAPSAPAPVVPLPFLLSISPSLAEPGQLVRLYGTDLPADLSGWQLRFPGNLSVGNLSRGNGYLEAAVPSGCLDGVVSLLGPQGQAVSGPGLRSLQVSSHNFPGDQGATAAVPAAFTDEGALIFGPLTLGDPGLRQIQRWVPGQAPQTAAFQGPYSSLTATGLGQLWLGTGVGEALWVHRNTLFAGNAFAAGSGAGTARGSGVEEVWTITASSPFQVVRRPSLDERPGGNFDFTFTEAAATGAAAPLVVGRQDVAWTRTHQVLSRWELGGLSPSRTSIALNVPSSHQLLGVLADGSLALARSPGGGAPLELLMAQAVSTGQGITTSVVVPSVSGASSPLSAIDAEGRWWHLRRSGEAQPWTLTRLSPNGGSPYTLTLTTQGGIPWSSVQVRSLHVQLAPQRVVIGYAANDTTTSYAVLDY